MQDALRVPLASPINSIGQSHGTAPNTVLSAQTSQANEDSDDEPLMLSRVRRIPTSVSAVEDTSNGTHTIEMSDVDHQEIVEDIPSGSRQYYVLRCVQCPKLRFPTLASLLFHYRNKREVHGFTCDETGAMIRCGIRVRGATASWARLHNSAVPNKEVISQSDGNVGLLTAQDDVSNFRRPGPAYAGNGPRRSLFMNRGEDAAEKTTPEQAESETIVVNTNFRETPSGFMGEAGPPLSAPIMPGFDGIFHSPACLKGVPSAKIDESSEYWEPTWHTWDQYINVDSEDQPTQVQNRRLRAKKFFEAYPQHPNQILAKQYVTKEGLLVGGTLEDMRQVLIYLRKAKEKGRIDISPFDWLRQRLIRLIEIHEARGLHWYFKQNFRSFRHDPEYRRVCEGLFDSDIQSDEAKRTAEHTGMDPQPQPLVCKIDHIVELSLLSRQVSTTTDGHGKVNQHSADHSIQQQRNLHSQQAPPQLEQRTVKRNRDLHDSGKQATTPRPSKVPKTMQGASRREAGNQNLVDQRTARTDPLRLRLGLPTNRSTHINGLASTKPRSLFGIGGSTSTTITPEIVNPALALPPVPQPRPDQTIDSHERDAAHGSQVEPEVTRPEAQRELVRPPACRSGPEIQEKSPLLNIMDSTAMSPFVENDPRRGAWFGASSSSSAQSTAQNSKEDDNCPITFQLTNLQLRGKDLSFGGVRSYKQNSRTSVLEPYVNNKRARYEDHKLAFDPSGVWDVLYNPPKRPEHTVRVYRLRTLHTLTKQKVFEQDCTFGSAAEAKQFFDLVNTAKAQKTEVTGKLHGQTEQKISTPFVRG